MLPFRAAIHVRPGSRVDRVGGSTPSARGTDRPALVVEVRARPVQGAATRAVEQVLAEALGVPRRQVRVVRGAGNRDKLVEVADPPPDLAQRWAALLERAKRPGSPPGGA